MPIDSVVALGAGIGAAALVVILFQMLQRKAQVWLVASIGALVMLSVGVIRDYTWGARMVEALPPGFVVVGEVLSRDWMRPWSLVAPITVQLSALDKDTVTQVGETDEMRLFDLHIFGRNQDVMVRPNVVHCTRGAVSTTGPKALIEPEKASWVSAGPALIQTACPPAQ